MSELWNGFVIKNFVFEGLEDPRPVIDFILNH